MSGPPFHNHTRRTACSSELRPRDTRFQESEKAVQKRGGWVRRWKREVTQDRKWEVTGKRFGVNIAKEEAQ